MAHNPTYPEPDAGSEAMHPYANQYSMPPPGHSHIPHPAEATMRRGSNDTGDFLHGNGHLAAELAQRSLDVNQGPNRAPDSSSRKRSKVSRACDECRRKKIRCDAESEEPGTSCSSCRRAATTCEFSRAPQKRGPSKGYIKELAERVNNLEYRTGAGAPETQFTQTAIDQPGSFLPPTEFSGRKRPYNSSAGSSYYDPTYNQLQDLAPRHESIQQDHSVRETPSTEVRPPAGDDQPHLSSMNATEVHADLIHKYYQLIHPVLPLLPHGTTIIQHNVQKVPAGVCEAFFGALDAAIQSCTIANAENSIKSASEHLLIINSDPQYTEMPLSKVVFLQALILMVIATDNMGPSPKKRSYWINFAIEAATSLQLHITLRSNDSINDSYVRGDFGRRAWLVLFILDRWHALGASDMLRIDEDSCRLVDYDRELMGENPYQLFRLSRAVGHLVKGYMFHKEELALPNSKGGILGNVVDQEIESFRESTYLNFVRMPAIHLAYLHVRQIADRYLDAPCSHTGAIVNSAFQIVTFLRQKKGVYCAPWIHHITGLAALTLGKAADLHLHPSATAALRDLREGLDTSLFRLHKEKTAWDIAISASITKRLDAGHQAMGTDSASDHGGLGQLADAAMGKSEATNNAADGSTSRDAGHSANWTAMTTQGYLNSI